MRENVVSCGKNTGNCRKNTVSCDKKVVEKKLCFKNAGNRIKYRKYG